MIRIAAGVCVLMAGLMASAAAEVRPDDLQYVGAFRLPGPGDGPDSWSFGGRALTYREEGDPSGPADGFPGSLFGSGHVWYNRVSEVSIPVPVMPPTTDAAGFALLPVAGTLQSFADPTGGIRDAVGVDHLGDLAWLPARPGQSGGKLYWTIYEYYNVAGDNYPGHGWSEPDLSAPAAVGAWHLGPVDVPTFHSMKTARYIFDVPQAWADAELGGMSLVSGRHREAGCCGSGEGPALFAFAPWLDGTPPGSPPAPGAEISGLPLVFYPTGGGHFPGYRACDDWSGAAFVGSDASGAALVVGRKALGETRYGLGDPGDCAYGTQGYHCDPYQPQFLLYAADDLAAVARGERQPWSVLPYATLNPQAYFWPSCSWNLGGAAFDRQRSLLYVVQTEAFEGNPVVHVFRLVDPQRVFADGFELVRRRDRQSGCLRAG